MCYSVRNVENAFFPPSKQGPAGLKRHLLQNGGCTSFYLIPNHYISLVFIGRILASLWWEYFIFFIGSYIFHFTYMFDLFN
jgi:hypothetical protein